MQAEDAKVEVICIIGGNGTIRECINGVMRRPDRDSITIALLGAGSASIERTLGIQTLEEGLQRLRLGTVRCMDVIALDDSTGKTTYGFVCGFGSYNEMAHQFTRSSGGLQSMARQFGKIFRHHNHVA